MITGAKSQAELRSGFDKMFYTFYEHRKEVLTTVPAPSGPDEADEDDGDGSADRV